MDQRSLAQEVAHNLNLGLPLLLKTYSKVPLVKWRSRCNLSTEALEVRASKPAIDWGDCLGPEVGVLGVQSAEAFDAFRKYHYPPLDCPPVKTARRFHVWFRHRNPLPSHKLSHLDCELRGVKPGPDFTSPEVTR